MNAPSSATQNLAVIRTLMERSAVYRRALGPILITVGALGLVGGVAGPVLGIRSGAAFSVYWFGIATVALVAAFLLSRREARREGEPFWSGPTREIARALAPPLLVAVAITLPPLVWGHPENNVVIWLIFYGMALHAAGAVAPAGLRHLGWALLVLAVAGYYWGQRIPVPGGPIVAAHLAMGATFGLLHLVYGLHILVSERRAPTS